MLHFRSYTWLLTVDICFAAAVNADFVSMAQLCELTKLAEAKHKWPSRQCLKSIEKALYQCQALALGYLAFTSSILSLYHAKSQGFASRKNEQMSTVIVVLHILKSLKDFSSIVIPCAVRMHLHKWVQSLPTLLFHCNRIWLNVSCDETHCTLLMHTVLQGYWKTILVAFYVKKCIFWRRQLVDLICNKKYVWLFLSSLPFANYELLR